MKAKEFDQKFDQGQEDIIEDLDLSQMRRPRHESKQIKVDFPLWMVDALDKEANRLGISRQYIIKVWIADHLRQQHS
ncbi:MAG: CopG family transcriptional regulator [Xenococcus sp. (in: cyanobacteria)]